MEQQNLGRRRSVRLRPSSQLHADYVSYDDRLIAERAHDLFQRRLEAQNFHDGYYQELQEILERAIRDDPTDHRLTYELAFILLQHRPSVERLARSRALLERIPGGDPELDGLVDRLHHVLGVMERNARVNTPDYRLARVNWAINNECPMICKGCYNPFTSGQLSLKEALLVLDKLHEHGATSLMVSGGDPLLWEHLDEFLVAAKSRGFQLGLDTTGYTLTLERAQQLSELVDSLGLPMDGSNNDVQRAFRRSPDRNLRDGLLSAIEVCERVQFPHVRLHTVVTSANAGDLGNMAAILARYRCIRQWALFQWWGRRASRQIAAQLAIPDDLFQRSVEAVAAMTPVEVLGYPARRREMTNFFIQSSGQVVTFGYCSGEEFILGNILDDPVDGLLLSPAVTQEVLIRPLVAHGY